MKQFDQLLLQAWDDDLISRNDFIGYTSFDLKDIFENKTKSGMYRLFPEKEFRANRNLFVGDQSVEKSSTAYLSRPRNRETYKDSGLVGQFSRSMRNIGATLKVSANVKTGKCKDSEVLSEIEKKIVGNLRLIGRGGFGYVINIIKLFSNFSMIKNVGSLINFSYQPCMHLRISYFLKENI